MMNPELWQTISDRVLLDLRQVGVQVTVWNVLDLCTRDKAAVALPVLASWIDRVEDPDMRHELYRHFACKHAYPWIDRLIGWWTKEDDSIVKGTIIRAMATTVPSAAAPKLIGLCASHREFDFRSYLLAKLCKDPATRESAVRLIVEDCAGSPAKSDLSDYAKVKDSRVLAAIEEVKQRSGTPTGSQAKKDSMTDWYCAAGEPDRRSELWSTEVAVDEFERVWQQIVSRVHGPAVAVPVLPCRSGHDTGQRWFSRRLSPAEESVELWLRYEDIDTLELVLTNKKA